MPSPFTEEHQQFRRRSGGSARTSSPRMPRSGRRTSSSRTGSSNAQASSGILGAHYPEEVRRRGRRLLVQRRQEPRSCPRCTDGRRRRWASSCSRTWRRRSSTTSAPGSRRTEFLDAGDPGREDRRARRERAERGQRRGGHPRPWPGETATTTSSAGSKTFITNGTRADFVTLLVKTSPDARRPRLQLLPRPHEDQGLSRRQEAEEDRQPLERHRRAPLRGHARPQALPPRRREHGVHVPHAKLPERAHHRLHERRRAGRRYSVDEAIAYGRDRQAFGKPIIKREYWQHKFVDLMAKLEAAQALTYRGAEAYNEDKYVKKDDVSMRDGEAHLAWRRSSSATSLSEIADQCLQFHGGLGVHRGVPRRPRVARPAALSHRRRHDRDHALLRRQADGLLAMHRKSRAGVGDSRGAPEVTRPPLSDSRPCSSGGETRRGRPAASALRRTRAGSRSARGRRVASTTTGYLRWLSAPAGSFGKPEAPEHRLTRTNSGSGTGVRPASDDHARQRQGLRAGDVEDAPRALRRA